MKAFDFCPTTRVVFGEGTLAQLGKLSKELGGSRILFVTDPGIVSAGLADRAIAVLQRASLDFFVFDSVGENPTDRAYKGRCRVCKSAWKILI